MRFCASCGAGEHPGWAGDEDDCAACGRPRLDGLLGSHRDQLACPRCGEMMDRSCAGCPSCGTPIPRVGAEPPSWCPGCGSDGPFVTWRMAADLGEPEVHTCAGCLGCWLEHAAWSTLRRHLEPSRLADPRRVPRVPLPDGFQSIPIVTRRCPRCAEPMLRENYGSISGVLVDQCLDHGWWFPPGHLHAVMRFVRRGGLLLARQRGLARRGDVR